EALSLAEQGHENGRVAAAHEIVGRAAEAMGQRGAADREFGIAIATLEQAGLADQLVTCRAKYSQLLEKRGDTEGALEQLKLAIAATRSDLAPAVRDSGVESETA